MVSIVSSLAPLTDQHLLIVPATPAPPAEISWQVLFWLLVPLAVNVMSQPSGRVCSIPRQHRTYLRASPIICLADVISILIRLTSYYVMSSRSGRSNWTRLMNYHLNYYLRYRFDDLREPFVLDKSKDDEEEPASEKLGVTQRTSYLRYLFFIFGGLGPGLKLIAMKGIPWVKTWGILFLVSFVVVEILVIMSYNRKVLRDDKIEPYRRQDVFSLFLDKVDIGILRMAFLAHAVLLFWLIADLWPKLTGYERILQSHFSNPTFGPASRVMGRLIILLIDIEFFLLIFTVGLLPMIHYDRPARFRVEPTTNYPLLFLRIIVIATILGCLFAALYFWVGLACFTADVMFLCMLSTPVWVMLKHADFWLSEHRTFCNMMQIANSKKLGSAGDNMPNSTGFWYFLAFLYTLVFTLIWFAFRYDKTGTENPSWTAVFG